MVIGWPKAQTTLLALDYVPRRMATLSCRGHFDESATELCCCTASMKQDIELQTDLILMRSTDSFRRQLKRYPFLLESISTPRNRLNLSCALGLLVQGAIQRPQLLLLLLTVTVLMLQPATALPYWKYSMWACLLINKKYSVVLKVKVIPDVELNCAFWHIEYLIHLALGMVTYRGHSLLNVLRPTKWNLILTDGQVQLQKCIKILQNHDT